MNKLLNLIFLTLLLTVSLLSSLPARSEIIVIVNKENPIKKIKRTELIDLYMKRHVQFSNGQPALPLDQKESELRNIFYSENLQVNMTQIDIYWARLFFAGRTRPPIKLKNSKEVLRYVKKNKDSIAYIDSQNLNDEVKVISIYDED